MTKRIALTFFIVLVLALTACERSASTPVPTANMPAVPTAEGMQVIMEAVTQTAIAQFGTPESEQLPEIVILDPDLNQGETPEPEATQDMAAENPTPQPLATTIPAFTERPATYTLQKGEFPFCIARRYNIDPDELLSLNGLTRSQGYFNPGIVLKIPQAGKAFPGSRALLPHPMLYIVLSGDTIYSIACKFGDVNPLEIASQNGLQPPYTLTVGSQLIIP